MKKTLILLLIQLFPISILLSQTRHDIDSLLSEISKIENSKYVSANSAAIKLFSYNDKALKFLTTYFEDTTRTNVKSDCQNFFLKRGELAIIVADTIERMPYALLTGIQNCLLEFCENNSNLIEYYLDAIRRDEIQVFTRKYFDWLVSKERKKWFAYNARKNRSN